MKMNFKMSSTKLRPFFARLHVLKVIANKLIIEVLWYLYGHKTLRHLASVYVLDVIAWDIL